MKTAFEHAVALAHEGTQPSQDAQHAWTTNCPQHEDNRPSLKIIDAESGPKAFCLAGCGSVNLS